jgi:hypothetical protein
LCQADQKIFAAFFSVIQMPQHSGIPTKAQADTKLTTLAERNRKPA